MIRYPLETLSKAGSNAAAVLSKPPEHWEKLAAAIPGMTVDDIKANHVARAIATDAGGVDWSKVKITSKRSESKANSWANRANGLAEIFRAMNRNDREEIFSAIASGDPLKAVKIFRRARN